MRGDDDEVGVVSLGGGEYAVRRRAAADLHLRRDSGLQPQLLQLRASIIDRIVDQFSR
jgi:hypothetical protein